MPNTRQRPRRKFGSLLCPLSQLPRAPWPIASATCPFACPGSCSLQKTPATACLTPASACTDNRLLPTSGYRRPLQTLSWQLQERTRAFAPLHLMRPSGARSLGRRDRCSSLLQSAGLCCRGKGRPELSLRHAVGFLMHQPSTGQTVSL